jgi:hypothetical protein
MSGRSGNGSWRLRRMGAIGVESPLPLAAACTLASEVMLEYGALKPDQASSSPNPARMTLHEGAS